MSEVAKNLRPHLVFIGKRNVGKSTLMNALTSQQVSITSEIPGTTTDSVEKTYELQPFGPVVFIDTAGVDDAGDLGQKRLEKCLRSLQGADLVLHVGERLTDFEYPLPDAFSRSIQGKPIIRILNKADLLPLPEIRVLDATLFPISAQHKTGLKPLMDHMVSRLEAIRPLPPLIADLVEAPGPVILVVPIDKEAPQGRIIQPQSLALRELLDHGVVTLVMQDNELPFALQNLKTPPQLVVTDSQAFRQVSAAVPAEISLTSFSILMARQRGDLTLYLQGLGAIPTLQDGDRILIAELCSHRPIGEDIGRIKIPKWLSENTGKALEFEVAAGKDIPDDLTPFKLIIQCGGCMVNRALIQDRLRQAREQNVPITNYGLAIAYLQGILPRAILPFPDILSSWKTINSLSPRAERGGR